MMDYQACLIHFEEAKGLISLRIGCLFLLMVYKQNTNEKKSEKIIILIFVLDFSQDFKRKKNGNKRKNQKIGMAFLPSGILIKGGE